MNFQGSLGFVAPSVPKEGDRIAVWFSCGAASAVAAKLTLDKYANFCDVRIINTPVAEEDEDNRRFLNDVASWLNRPIELARNPDYPSDSAESVWEKRRYMAGPEGAPCTKELKKQARYDWEGINRPHWHVLGFAVEEKKRHLNFIKFERENTLPILIEAKLTRKDCAAFVVGAGIALPRIYSMGYPNANCIGCVKASSPTYWNHVRKTHPEIFKSRADLSRRLGARLVVYKGERIFLDELPIDAVGRPIKTISHDCGIFCETDAPKVTLNVTLRTQNKQASHDR